MSTDQNPDLQNLSVPNPSGFSPVTPAQITSYVQRLHRVKSHPVIEKMEKLAEENRFPIVGRAAGEFLHLMALSIGAKQIFEFGSGFGYSAYWFSLAVGENGKVICTEGDAKNVERAGAFLAEAGLTERVEYHCAWAQEHFKQTFQDFDLIYNDADKDAYPEIWQLARTRLRPGGLYIADNALWSGRVTLPSEEVHESKGFEGWTAAIRDHNRLIAEDSGFEFFINPIRDGLIVARKIG